MMDLRARAVIGVFVAALSGCSSTSSTTGSTSSSGFPGSSGSSSSSGSDPSACSVVGTWHTAFQWSGRTPGDLALVVAADDTVQIPSAPGVSPATGTVSVSGKQITWKMSDGSTMTGTADATCSFITAGTMTSSTGTPGTFTARKNACDADGTWNVTFQWSGRTPGQLAIIVAADQSARIPSGPGVGAATGTTAIDGYAITWSMSDGSTMTGTADANCQIINSGTMRSSTGTPGAFTAHK
jgi:hypothetical protein